jgi:hypothetical protein
MTVAWIAATSAVPRRSFFTSSRSCSSLPSASLHPTPSTLDCVGKQDGQLLHNYPGLVWVLGAAHHPVECSVAVQADGQPQGPLLSPAGSPQILQSDGWYILPVILILPPTVKCSSGSM